MIDHRPGDEALLVSPQTLRAARDLIEQLRSHGLTVATAESLTGGLCCAALTSVPGSSAVVRGGVIVYATELKSTLGGVNADELASCGPVSEVVARELAAGVRRSTGADWGLALTGVAGPDRQAGQPPGTVWIAAHGPQAQQSKLLTLTGSRAQIRDAAIGQVLELCTTSLS